MNSKALISIAILVIVLGGAGWWIYKKKHDDKTEYQTAPVTRGDITQAVTATGSCSAVISVQVGSQVSGNIDKLFADYNTPVKENQVVAQLDASIFQAMVHQAEGDRASSQAALELARVTAKRKDELFAQHAAPQADVDNAVAALHQAEATVQIKQANLETAKVNLDHCTIYSPINGIVISRSVDVGQTVAAAMNAPVLFTIANDLSKMQIDASVAEADVGNVEPGQNVDFTVDAFPYRTFHGKVTQVRNSPITVQNVVTYDTVISVDNEDQKLRPGMTATVSIIVAHKENVLKIPNGALRFRPPEAQQTGQAASNGAGVKDGAASSQIAQNGGGAHARKQHLGTAARTIYILPDGAAKLQPVQVKLGISDGINTEVTEGLKENDQIVTGAVYNQHTASSQGAPNPFGGGMRRF